MRVTGLSMASLTGAAFLPACDRPVEATPARKRLTELLAQNQRHEMVHGFATRLNHVPMVLIALYRLGASVEQLDAYWNQLRRPRHDVRPRQRRDVITAKHWTAGLGDRRLLHAYVKYFGGQIEAHGSGPTLAAHVPHLLRGSLAAALHCVIKLGYAVDIRDNAEIALALAYFATQFAALPAAAQGDGAPVSFPAFIASLDKDPALTGQRNAARSIFVRAQQVARHPHFAKARRPLRLDAKQPLHEIAATVRQAFAKYHHFTLLHALTSTQALRLVLPHLPERTQPITDFAHALGAAYVTAVYMSAHDLTRPLPKDAPAVSALRAGGAAAGNEHTIKVTYSCLSEHAAYGHADYLRLAARDQASAARFT